MDSNRRQHNEVGQKVIIRLLSLGLIGLLLTAGMWPAAAEALEYRLQVASLYDDALFALLGAAGTRREGPVQGHSRLLELLDAGEAPAGVLLYDPPPEAARTPVATAFGAPRLRAEVRRGEDKLQWDEVRWDGKPGEQSVWVIAPSRPWLTEVRNVALKGTGSLVWAIPHRLARSHPLVKAVGIPLGFIQAYESKTALWEKHLATALDLRDGLAVVVGENSSSPFADHIFIIVKHAPTPTTYKLVLGWERRPHEFQAR